MGFGDFDSICKQVPLPLCANVGTTVPTEANCYARNINVANTIIFEGAASFAHIAALIMTVIMILHVRSKFTAVGRKEIIAFFYLYMGLTLSSLILDAGVVPPGSSAYPYFAAVQNGLVSALCVSLLINGFVGFQIYEDGTFLSIWLLRILSLLMFVIMFLVSLGTFKSFAGMAPDKTTGMFVVLYIVNAAFLVVWAVMQVLLVLGTLQDRWPLGDIAFAAFFFIIGQVIMYVFSETICDAVQHYLDGLFLATICNLLAVMMVYKYWDSITKEDLEFSVGTKQNSWEVKELIPEDDRRNTTYVETEYSHSMYKGQSNRESGYGYNAY